MMAGHWWQLACAVLYLLGGFMAGSYAADAGEKEPKWALVSWPLWAVIILSIKAWRKMRADLFGT